jgi:CRISPR/Cas system-associated exonuclease Cas4 (RecB family)
MMTRPIKSIADLDDASVGDVEAAKKEVTVVEDLDRYLRWLYGPEGTQTEGTFRIGHRKRSKGVHPSSIAKTGYCPLKIYYDITWEVKPLRKVDMTMQPIYDLGTLLHAMHQMHFNNMYDDQFQDEVWLVDKQLMINSHADGIFNFSLVRFVLEMKSIKEGGNFGWERIQHKPFKDNVRQCMSYMATSDCPFGLILYINKNNSKKKEHPLIFDPVLWEEIRAPVLPIVAAARGEGPKPSPKTGRHCKECDYYNGCPYGRRAGSGERQKHRFFRRG